MKKAVSNFSRKAQRGFTLIELVVVVAIIGVLIALLAPSVTGSKNGARATLLTKTVQSVSSNWMLISQSCGTTTDVGSSPVITSGKKFEDVIFGGEVNVAAAYKSCYKQANVLPLADLGQPKGAGTWAVESYVVEFTGGGTIPFKGTYKGVPDELVLIMATKYTPSLTELASSDTASAVIQYGAATNGVRDVSVLRFVN